MPVDTLGLIDTGAAFSAIAPGIAQKLSLKQQGRQPVMAVGDKTQSFQPVFYGGLLLDDGHAYDTTLTEVELAFDKRIAVLIGRDILAFYELTYNGVRKEFSLTAQN
jgi:predicted aspartyl protease